jgi:hypothetical protein
MCELFGDITMSLRRPDLRTGFLIAANNQITTIFIVDVSMFLAYILNMPLSFKGRTNRS